MSSAEQIRSAVDRTTEPEQPALERARMIVVDKLGEWESLGVDELVESVCEAYEAPSGEPLRLSDVDPASPEADSPALRNLRYARAARTAIIDLERAGEIVAVEAHPGDAEAVDLTGERNGNGRNGGSDGENDDDDEATVTKETTGPAAEKAGADEVVLSTGPQPRGLRYALASR